MGHFIEDKDLRSKLQIESRIATRLNHIGNVVELDNNPHKEYILHELKLIHILVDKLYNM